MMGWRSEGPTDEQCRWHGQPITLAVEGPGTRYTACDAAGCWRDAEAGHRMQHGAGYLPTVRTRYGGTA